MHDTPSERLAADPTSLPVDRIDVWVVSLTDAGNQPSRGRWLSPDERARGERFVFERDRGRFVLGRAALRSILANYLGCNPAEIGFAYGESGKPRLEGAAAASGLQFNASGSADLAVCAVTYGRSVGIDIERLRDDCDPDLVQHAPGERERDDFQQIPPDPQPAVFYRTWTRKEAFLKATGCGLSRSLTSFAVSVRPGDPPRLLRDDSPATARETWSFADFDPAPGWVGTIVHAGEPRPVHRRAWNG